MDRSERPPRRLNPRPLLQEIFSFPRDLWRRRHRESVPRQWVISTAKIPNLPLFPVTGQCCWQCQEAVSRLEFFDCAASARSFLQCHRHRLGLRRPNASIAHPSICLLGREIAWLYAYRLMDAFEQHLRTRVGGTGSGIMQKHCFLWHFDIRRKSDRTYESRSNSPHPRFCLPPGSDEGPFTLDRFRNRKTLALQSPIASRFRLVCCLRYADVEFGSLSSCCRGSPPAIPSALALAMPSRCRSMINSLVG